MSLAILGSFGTFSAYAFDSTPPTVDSCSVTPSSLPDTGGTITATIHITSLNGVSGLPVAPFYLQGDTTRQLGGLTLQLQSGDIKSGTWTETVNVPGNLMPGKYVMTIFPLSDTAQNSTKSFYACPNAVVQYGTVNTPMPTPSASPISQGAPDYLSQIVALQSQVASLTAEVQKMNSYKLQVLNLTNQLHRICAVKKKPAGC